ncbi:hypothetical protein AMECASPLE_002644 [Ameca splendens]|uniref:Uncharacterized protein n=1 Tax=Ameca splendens TaxID=208324 RepID=A0ABV1A529_9TELE
MCSTTYAEYVTHCVYFNLATKLSVSNILCEKKIYLHICLSDNVHLGRLVHEPGYERCRHCTRHICLLLLDLPKLQVLRVLFVAPSECEKCAVWKAHVQRNTSHYTVTDCHCELKLEHKRRQALGENR